MAKDTLEQSFYKNSTFEPACDLNHDGKIDGNDFIVFSGDYMVYWRPGGH